MARILVADDAAFMRMMIKNILTQNGHEVVGEAENGVEAVARYAELKPDVTTMDITMPEKDGIAALKELLAGDPAAKVVMCSALGHEAKVIESIRSGAKASAGALRVPGRRVPGHRPGHRATAVEPGSPVSRCPEGARHHELRCMPAAAHGRGTERMSGAKGRRARRNVRGARRL